ncbi:V-type proton ATPase subunit S1-like [Harmonia axyridis]|uniref:V-type proton ATPase subunit S1-like n=1 Tax=Harmonia axyridis TaxID=115357 RepID=UPI001E2760A5|nr:V-type proton ATPase subunit S1-like [Harmonia axyridis]
MFKYYFLVFFLHMQSIEQVPVLMWETNQELNSTLGKYSPLESKAHDLRTIISRIFKRKIPIIVYLEETLSLEDLIIRNEYGSTIFPGLSSFINSFNSYFMPYAENPIETIEEIASPVKKIDSSSFHDYNNWHELATLVINLKMIKTNESRENMLKKHDFTILQMHSKFANMHTHIFSIFTARYPSWIIPEYSERHNFKKLLQSESESESEPPTGTPTETKVVPIVDDKNLLLVISGNGEYSSDNGAKFSPVTLSRSDFSIKDNDMTLSLDGGGVKVTFIIVFGSDGFWTIENITLDEKPISFDEIAVPMNFSYHCSNLVLSNEATKQILKIIGFQIQPFKDEQEQQQFGDAYDCVGFVSIPICSGIFIVSILLLILFCGIVSMMDIETADRYDDPNGKVFKAYVEYS